jgi:hypothetical protein
MMPPTSRIAPRHRRLVPPKYDSVQRIANFNAARLNRDLSGDIQPYAKSPESLDIDWVTG